MRRDELADWERHALLELETTPGRRWALFGLSSRARLAGGLGRLSLELRRLDADVDRGPAPELLLARGKLRLSLGCPDAAVEDLAAAGLEQARAPLGQGLAMLGRWEEALSALDSGLWRAQALAGLGRKAASVSQLRACERQRPESALPQQLLARLRDAEGAYDDLARALARNPGNKWAFLVRARAGLAAGDLALAEREFEAAMRLDPHVCGFSSAAQPGDPRPADLRELDSALAAGPRPGWLLAWRGQFHYDRLRLREAERDLSAAVAASPESGWIRALWARLEALYLGRFREAGESLDFALRASPDCAWIRAWRGYMRLRGGDAAGAVEDLDEAIAAVAGYGLAYGWRAQAREALGDVDGAWRDLDCAIELDPSYGTHYDRRRRLRWLRGDRAGAWEDMACAVRREPRCTWSGGWRRPDDEAPQASQERPRHARARAWAAETRLEQGRPAEAAALADEAIAVDPGCAWAWAFRGEALRRLARLPEAEASLRRSIVLGAGYAKAHYWLALALSARGRVRSAIVHLGRAVRLDFSFAAAYLERARLHRRNGRLSQALWDLERASSLDGRGEPPEVVRLVDAGRLDDAVEALTGFRPRRPLAVRLQPMQDLCYATPYRLSLRRPDDRAGDLQALKAVRGAAVRWPRSGYAKILRGMLRLFVGDLPAAERDLSEGLRLAPRSAWGYLWRYCCRALLARRRQDFSMLEVAQDLDAAVALDPGNPLAWSLRAELRHDRDLRPQALEDLKQVLRLEPASDWARAERAEIFVELGRYGEASPDFECLIRRHRRSAWPYIHRGRARANSGRLAPAVADFRRALAMEPRSGLAAAWLAEALWKMGDWKAARLGFDRALRLDPGYALAYGWRGRVRLALGDFRGAAADLTSALARDPRHFLAYAWRAEARLRLGAAREAARDLDAVFPFHPRNSWAPGLRDRVARERELWRCLDEAVRRSPSKWPLALRGRLLLDSPQRALSLADLDAALALDPGFAWARAWRGEWLRREGRLSEALVELDRAVRADPRCGWARLWRAAARLDSGRHPEAEADLGAVLERNPDLPLAYRLRAEARSRLGRPAEALADARRSFLLSPDEEAARLLRRLSPAEAAA